MNKVDRVHIDPRLYESIYSCLQALNYLAYLLPLSEGSKRLIRSSLFGASSLHIYFDYDKPLDYSAFNKELDDYVSSSFFYHLDKE